MSNAWETNYGLNPYSATDAAEDPDGDGISNVNEYTQGSDPLVNPAGYAAAVLGATPVGYWRMNDTNSTALDAVAQPHNGTYSGTYTQGQQTLVQSGGSVTFGSTGSMQVPNNSAFNASGDFAIEFFARWTTTSQNPELINKSNGGSNGGLRIGLNTKVANGTTYPLSGYVHFTDVGVLNSHMLSTTTSNNNDGTWRHFAFVRRGATLEIWINGVLNASRTLPTPVLAMNDTTAFYLMNRYAGVGGSIDEVAYYTHSLTPLQIKAHFMSQATDSDSDGLPNVFEFQQGFNPADASDGGSTDTDGDGHSNVDEYLQQTDPWVNPTGYGSAVLADAPIGYWRLDDANTTAVDASGQGRTGTYTTPYTQLVTPLIAQGTAVTFSGGKITVPHNTALNMTGDYTIEMYLKWSGTAVSTVFEKMSSGVGPRIYPNMNAGNAGPGRVCYNETYTTGPTSTQTSLNNGQWRHYAFVRRGLSLEMWIDGVLDASTTITSIPAFTTTTPLLIGGGSSYSFTGSLDEVAFYNRALSPLDIRQHQLQGLQQIAALERPASRELYALGLGADGRRSTVLITDSAAPSNAWMYDSHSDPSLKPIEYLDRVDHDFFNTVMTVDSVGIDLLQKSEFSPDGYTYARRPAGLKLGTVPVSGGALIESWTYGYDTVSNITSITKPSGVESYGYDALDRLNAYTLPGQAQVTYGYDFDGNRLSETQSGVTVNHTYGTTSNRQLTAAGAAIGYDANGNRTSDSSSGTRTFTYTVRNRLKQAVANSVTVGTYAINGLGQRVRKLAGASDVDYVFDLSGKLIGEYANGTLIREYLYLDNLPVAQIVAGGAITYLHPDHLGTPRSATNSNAQIVWRWDSDPFGKATPNQDPDGDLTNVTVNLRFPGQYFDMEAGLNYNYFRDYDATMGRYVESDPIGFAGGINSYGYVDGNPILAVDSLGLETCLLTTVGPAGIRDHSAVYTSRGDGSGGPAIYDPAGQYSYVNGGGSGDVVEGDAASVAKYIAYHKSQAVETACKNTKQKEEEAIIRKASELSDLYGGAPPFSCAIRSSTALSGQPSFPYVKPGTFFPGNLRRQVERAP